jgi:hypothetical protein
MVVMVAFCIAAPAIADFDEINLFNAREQYLTDLLEKALQKRAIYSYSTKLH